MRTLFRLSLLFSVLSGASVHAQDQEPSSEGAAEETLPDEVLRALDAAEQTYFQRLAETAAASDVDEDNPFWLEDNQLNWSAVRSLFERPSWVFEASPSDAMSAMRYLYDMGGAELRPLYAWIHDRSIELDRELEEQARRVGSTAHRSVGYRSPHYHIRQEALDILNEIDAIIAAEAESAPSTEPTTAPTPDVVQEPLTEQPSLE